MGHASLVLIKMVISILMALSVKRYAGKEYTLQTKLNVTTEINSTMMAVVQNVRLRITGNAKVEIAYNQILVNMLKV